jgi:hypothetical protein
MDLLIFTKKLITGVNGFAKKDRSILQDGTSKINRYVLRLSPESNLDTVFGRSSDSFCFNAFPSANADSGKEC